MLTILNLFGKSPFAPLQKHMDIVSLCIQKLKDYFIAFTDNDFEKMEEIAKEISKMEHKADQTKNDIRNHLPKTLFLPIDRSHLLEILSLQDSIADQTEDIVVLMGFKKIEMIDAFKDPFHKFLQKNLESFEGARLVMNELHELLETSFGGVEAQKVRSMVENIAHLEHEADLLQRDLLKMLFQFEDKMSYATFFLWQKVFSEIASISNLSEKLGNRIRMTLDLK